jgi:hypothetical protein
MDVIMAFSPYRVKPQTGPVLLEALPRQLDLLVLAATARVVALVVAVEEERKFVAMGVEEHPQREALVWLGALCMAAVHLENLLGVPPDAELEEAVAQRFAHSP